MTKLAVIKTGGKQYLAQVGAKLKLEKLNADAGSIFAFGEVLLLADGKKIEVGAPTVDKASVFAKVLRQERARKQIVFRYHAKTRYRKKKGHRQHFTEVEVTKIEKL
ncbi:50S ribosomal protein L21 [Patescibacteria group bacterium]|nr:50S ribosomal protein L21 [Patescibacteria group bacterium]